MTFRIVGPWRKVAFVASWVVVNYATGWALGFLTSSMLSLIIGIALSLLFLIVGVRVFRGRNENVLHPRPWWRMTARPPAGYVLAVLFFLYAVYFLIPYIGRGIRNFPLSVLDSAISGPIAFIVAVLYLHSSLRLRTILRSSGEGRKRASSATE